MKEENRPLKKVYTAKEIAQMLEVSIREAYNLIQTEGEKGSFSVIRFGSRPNVRADMESFNAWYDRGGATGGTSYGVDCTQK